MIASTALSTTDNTAVVALTAAAINAAFRLNLHHRSLRIVNEGEAAGYYSTDKGVTWARLPASFAITDDKAVLIEVQIKRVADGTNLSNVFVSAW